MIIYGITSIFFRNETRNIFFRDSGVSFGIRRFLPIIFINNEICLFFIYLTERNQKVQWLWSKFRIKKISCNCFKNVKMSPMKPLWVVNCVQNYIFNSNVLSLKLNIFTQPRQTDKKYKSTSMLKSAFINTF